MEILKEAVKQARKSGKSKQFNRDGRPNYIQFDGKRYIVCDAFGPCFSYVSPMRLIRTLTTLSIIS